jgi:hypothetical protein
MLNLREHRLIDILYVIYKYLASTTMLIASDYREPLVGVDKKTKKPIPLLHVEERKLAKTHCLISKENKGF